jgi:ribosome-associated protein
VSKNLSGQSDYHTAMNASRRKGGGFDHNSYVNVDGEIVEYDYGDDEQSRTKLKEAAHELQELGAVIIDLPAERLKKLSAIIPERLLDAVKDARKITAHGGRRRQMLYVGKIVRELSDEDVAAIRAAIASYNQTDAASIAKFHELERWREMLIENDDTLTEFIQTHTRAASPDTMQRLRALIRNARKEREQPNKPPQNYRELFQLLKDIASDAT